MTTNGVIMQYFEWNLENDGKHWQRLKEDATHLKEIGISAVWLPPTFKATSSNDVGYGVYDLYDLGEFDQKGSVRTKYGYKEELIAAIEVLQAIGIDVYADVVLNHKAGGDKTERFQVVPVDEHDRNHEIGQPFEIEAWTYFNFPGRYGQYSDFEWHFYHFTGVDFNQANGKNGIYKILGDGKDWAKNDNVDPEYGNYDYLMFNDIDYSHPDVVNEILSWAKWFVQETGIDGFRLDAVKHINDEFTSQLVEVMHKEFGHNFFIMEEYWTYEFATLKKYVEERHFKTNVMDVTLHYRFHQASVEGSSFDMRRLAEESLNSTHSTNAITFVDNHDSQPGQSLESFVESWFKPIAYGLILLTTNGYPIVFYGDYYGIKGVRPKGGHQHTIDKLLKLRLTHAYGPQTDYFDHENCIGFTRSGNETHDGLALIVSNGKASEKTMYIGENYSGQTFIDAMGHINQQVEIDSNGSGKFFVPGGSISVWVPSK